ncbi:DddA-like double-stranded DNA deaminase toxin [Streptomyces griseoaurantiacus]|uniref:DddA-like double-stranded DNA deaminase toxin n=1 Tax=Streptomyces griseoaurantiacus TaxID=68213 RepID=UPI0038670133
MRTKNWSNAHLFIDQDYICGRCFDHLPRMLPKNATLRVTWRDGSNEIQTQSFVGS